jgi:hypothetical protein
MTQATPNDSGLKNKIKIKFFFFLTVLVQQGGIIYGLYGYHVRKNTGTGTGTGKYT